MHMNHFSCISIEPWIQAYARTKRGQDDFTCSACRALWCWLLGLAGSDRYGDDTSDSPASTEFSHPIHVKEKNSTKSHSWRRHVRLKSNFNMNYSHTNCASGKIITREEYSLCKSSKLFNSFRKIFMNSQCRSEFTFH